MTCAHKDDYIRRMQILSCLFCSLALAIFPSAPALADPCTAPLPSQIGSVFSGSVRYIGDGDSLCIGATPNPSTWIEVRLADIDAPELHQPGGREAKDRLGRIALGRHVRCTVTRGRNGRTRSYDRVISVCRIGGRSIAEPLHR